MFAVDNAQARRARVFNINRKLPMTEVEVRIYRGVDRKTIIP